MRTVRIDSGAVLSSRWTVISRASPASLGVSACRTSAMRCIARPFISVMRSPLWSPDLAAGEPVRTVSTTGRPLMGSVVEYPIPRSPGLSVSPFLSRGMRGMMSCIGMANPTPESYNSVPVDMPAVSAGSGAMMPKTWPSMLSRGPP